MVSLSVFTVNVLTSNVFSQYLIYVVRVRAVEFKLILLYFLEIVDQFSSLYTNIMVIIIIVKISCKISMGQSFAKYFTYNSPINLHINLQGYDEAYFS